MNEELKPRKRPRQQRSRAVVDAIMEAATRILVADGFAKMTTNQVAELAGVSIGSLYQYFPNKEAICYGVSEKLFEEFTASYLEALHEELEASFETRIKKLVDVGIEIAQRFPVHVSSTYGEFNQFGGFDPLKKSREILIPQLAALLASRPEGLRPQYPEVTAYIGLTSVSEVIADVIFQHSEWLKDEVFLEHLYSLVIGLYEKSLQYR